MSNQQKTQTQAQPVSTTYTGEWYMVTSPHTVDECMQVIDQIADSGKHNLSQWRWGCQQGDHTSYAFIQANSQDEALRTVPEIVRYKAKVAKVEEFTEDQIRNWHNK